MNSSILIDERFTRDTDGPVTRPDVARGVAPAGQGARRRQAEAAPVETLEQILGSLVHAVSNSLNSIMSTSQLANLLMTQKRLDEARIALSRVDEECLRAARLLRDGRSLAALKVPESVGGADVATLLDLCAAACSGLGNVHVECDTALPLVHGQADALKRMFVEILDNAFQFGAGSVLIVAGRDEDGGAVRVEFRDDGPGIRIQSRTLFESFVSSEPDEHSGLGLAFATQIAAAYGGSIGLDDSPNGAVFWVRLPFEVKAYPPSN
jgi:signal transduction histidine kinase